MMGASRCSRFKLEVKTLKWRVCGVKRAYQSLLRPDQRPVLAVHLVVQPTRVAQVVPGPITAPKGRRRGATVDTLSGLWFHIRSTRA